MEFKVNLGQIVVALIQTIGYVVTLLYFAWKASKEVTQIKSDIKNVTEDLHEHKETTEKSFLKIDRIFEKWEDRFFGKNTPRR